MKVVINKKHGGFGISEKAAEKLIEEYNWQATQWEDGEYADSDCELIDRKKGPEGEDHLVGPRYGIVGHQHGRDVRCNDDLISVVENLEDEASAEMASLKVVEVPDEVEWEIKEYDGAEWVAEEHRTWS